MGIFTIFTLKTRAFSKFLEDQYMLFAGWEVRMWKTVTEVLKMLPEVTVFNHTDLPFAGK